MTEALTAYGPLGIAVVGLSWVVIRLYGKIETLRDKREADVQILAKIVEQNTATNNRYADILEEFANRLPGWISGKDRR